MTDPIIEPYKIPKKPKHLPQLRRKFANYKLEYNQLQYEKEHHTMH